MLSVNNYSQDYINECRSRTAARVSSYLNLIAAARKQTPEDDNDLENAIKDFEPHFFNNMILSLDNCFAHRARAKELKDGNPLNEVRMLVNSIISNKEILAADKTIKYNPDKSVVKYKIGDEIKLHESDFVQLASAFFAEIENKYL